jgi:hypothetical protein
MKKRTLYIILISPLTIFCQPVESEIKSLVESAFLEMNETILSMDFESGRNLELSGTRRENEGQGWETNYYKHVHVTTKHNSGKDAKKVWHLAAKYQVSGSKYSFERINWGNTKLIDLEFPEVEAAIELTLSSYKNLKTLFGGLSSRVLASPIDVYISDDPKFKWYNEDSYSFEVWIDYNQVSSNTEVDKMKSLKKLRFYKNEETGEFDSFITQNSGYPPKSLEKKKYTVEEVDYMTENSTVFVMARK